MRDSEPPSQEGNQRNLSWQEGCRESLKLGQPPVEGVRVSHWHWDWLV